MVSVQNLLLYFVSKLENIMSNIDDEALPTEKKINSRRGVGDKPMSCKPGVEASIPGFSQSVGRIRL